MWSVGAVMTTERREGVQTGDVYCACGQIMARIQCTCIMTKHQIEGFGRRGPAGNLPE